MKVTSCLVFFLPPNDSIISLYSSLLLPYFFLKVEIQVKVLESESGFLPPNDFIISLYSPLLLPDFFLKVEIKEKVIESESDFLPSLLLAPQWLHNFPLLTHCCCQISF